MSFGAPVCLAHTNPPPQQTHSTETALSGDLPAPLANTNHRHPTAQLTGSALPVHQNHVHWVHINPSAGQVQTGCVRSAKRVDHENSTVRAVAPAMAHVKIAQSVLSQALQH